MDIKIREYNILGQFCFVVMRRDLIYTYEMWTVKMN